MNQRVIKPVYGNDKAVNPTPLSLSELQGQGDRIIEQAKQQAADILEAARRQAKLEGQQLRIQATEQGKQEGLQQGQQQGRQQGQQQAQVEAAKAIEKLCVGLTSAVDQINEMHQRLHRQAESDLLGLSMSIARKVVKSEVSTRSTEIAQGNLESALELVRNKSMLWIHVHPDDAKAMQQYLSSIAEILKTDATVKVLADESIEPGGAVVRTDAGEIDARIQAQLDRLENELLHPASKPSEENDGE